MGITILWMLDVTNAHEARNWLESRLLSVLKAEPELVIPWRCACDLLVPKAEAPTPAASGAVSGGALKTEPVVTSMASALKVKAEATANAVNSTTAAPISVPELRVTTDSKSNVAAKGSIIALSSSSFATKKIVAFGNRIVEGGRQMTTALATMGFQNRFARRIEGHEYTLGDFVVRFGMVSVGPKLESNRLALEIGYAPCVSVADGLAVCQSLLASLVASEPGFAFSGTGSGPRDTLGGAGSATGIGSPSLPFPDPLMFNAKTSPFLNYSTAYSPSLFAKFSLADEFSLRHLAAQYAATFFAQQLATSEL